MCDLAKMDFFCNSLFYTRNVGLIAFYLQQAVEKSTRKNLKDVDQAESEEIISNLVYPAVVQCEKEALKIGNWRYGKDDVLLQIHGWFYMSWMSTKFDSFDKVFVPIGTVFYAQVVEICHFEQYLIECLIKTNNEVMKILIQDFVKSGKAYHMKDEKNFRLFEQCLLQLCNCQENVNGNIDGKLYYIITEITENIEQQWLQDKIVTTLIEKLNTLLSKRNQSSYIGNSFKNKTDILGFSESLSKLINAVERPNVEMMLSAKEKNGLQHLSNTILCLVTFMNHVMRSDWFKCLAKQFNVNNEDVNTLPSCYHPLLSLFKSCKLLQTLAVDKDVVFYKQLQILIELCVPYLKQNVTQEEFEMSNGQSVGNMNNSAASVMIHGTIDDKFQHALREIEDNLISDEACFEWLLSQEELFTNEQWLNCIQIHSSKFISIKVMKMLLDVLYLLHCYDVGQEGVHKDIYNSLIKVILDGLCHLTISEQKEVVLYNFKLTLVQFKTYEYSLFLCSGNETGKMEDILMKTLNKVVHSSPQGFPKHLMDDIIKSSLISPYLLLKKLFICAVHGRYEKVILELLQTIPWLVQLRCSKDIKTTEDVDSPIVKVIRFMFLYVVRVKQQTFRNFLTFIEVLMKPFIHPVFGIEEPALVSALEISKNVVIPLLKKSNQVCATNDEQVNIPLLKDKEDIFFLMLKDVDYNIVITDAEYDDLTILVLNVLLKCLSSGLVSYDQEHSIDGMHLFQLLFIILDIYEDVQQIIQDLIMNESEEDITDCGISFICSFMDVSLKIVEEYLVPFLKEDMSHEPTRYLLDISTLKNALNKLDWMEQLLLIPLFQTVVFKDCKFKSPSLLLNLMSAHWNVDSAKVLDSTSFWIMYFKSCAISKEVFEMFLLMLKDGHPRGIEIADNENEKIFHDLARVLPFTTRKQWQRVLNIAGEMIKYRYLVLPEGWKTRAVKFPDISYVYHPTVIKTSEILVLILNEMSNMKWVSAGIWSVTLDNYAFNMREQFKPKDNQKFEVIFHLLAHVTYITFKIVPNDCQSFITGMILEIFKQCLSTEDAEKNKEYLQDIINMTTNNELKQIMESTMARQSQSQ